MNLTRLHWSDIPASLRNRAEQAVATPLHEIASASGGFTPGVASTVAGASGARFFVKAIARHTSEVAGAYLREARIAEALPALVARRPGSSCCSSTSTVVPRTSPTSTR